MKPIVKWQGGKRQLINEIDKRLPITDIKRIIEPFVGGGSIFLKYEKPAIINDINKDLISVYIQSVKNKKSFNQELLKITNNFNKSNDKKAFYLNIRQQKPKNDLERATRFVFLNKTCFNGRYRENSKGEFNVPFSGIEKINLQTEDIKNTIDNLKNVDIHNKDYKKFFDWYLSGEFKDGDFLFIDPPYDESGLTYTSSGFSQEDQESLKEYFDKITQLKIPAIICNHNTDFIRELYKDYNIDIVMARRSINVNPDGRGPVEEVMILNYEIGKDKKDNVS